MDARDLPSLKNPDSHYVVTANNKVLPAALAPYASSWAYAPPYRAARIAELLAANSGKKLTVQDLAKMQSDVVSLRARRLLPVFLATLERNRDASDEFDRAWRQLVDWDGAASADLAAPTIFAEAYWQAFALTYQDEMSPALFDWFAHSAVAQTAFDNLLASGGDLFDDRTTAVEDDREHVVLAALESALTVLAARSGPRMSTWEWGKYHRLELRHPLGNAPELQSAANFFKINLGSHPLAGDRDTINNGAYAFGGGYEVVTGASMRHVVDLGTMEDARCSYPGGQSGQPFSAHYADLLALWRHGRGHPMLMPRAAVEAGAASRVELVPMGGTKGVGGQVESGRNSNAPGS